VRALPPTDIGESAMGCGTPNIAFSSSNLDGLDLVYDEVCEAIEHQRGQLRERTKSSIRKHLFLLACNGMNDPEALRNRLVTSFTRSRKPSTNGRQARPVG